jgi:hypothetical protein
MLLLSLTAREGRLSTDADASLQTGWVPALLLKSPRGIAVVCLGVEFGAPRDAHGASKPANVLLF